MDPRELRSTFGRFATGVTVVTCTTPDGEPHGATVTAFLPVSLDPPLVQVALTRRSKACGYLEGAAYAVNVLAADQVDVAMHFAGRPGAAPAPWAEPVRVDGIEAPVPVLAGTAATLVCHPRRTDDGGDHLLHLGEVVHTTVSHRSGLLFHDSAFHDVGARTSDTVWLGCQDDPHTGWFHAGSALTPYAARAGSTPGTAPRVPADTHY
ncbi:MAG: flavin reductase [Nocardioides sp.]|nr:flavin reductase [Nocardioides sp.]